MQRGFGKLRVQIVMSRGPGDLPRTPVLGKRLLFWLQQPKEGLWEHQESPLGLAISFPAKVKTGETWYVVGALQVASWPLAGSRAGADKTDGQW